ncbi:hypothetical protein J6590_014548 [Homalodisca vitripennis]|nr:hypothetical protein J6590_014548 [Homalodisca vitripennis]
MLGFESKILLNNQGRKKTVVVVATTLCAPLRICETVATNPGTFSLTKVLRINFSI